MCRSYPRVLFFDAIRKIACTGLWIRSNRTCSYSRKPPSPGKRRKHASDAGGLSARSARKTADYPNTDGKRGTRAFAGGATGGAVYEQTALQVSFARQVRRPGRGARGVALAAGDRKQAPSPRARTPTSIIYCPCTGFTYALSFAFPASSSSTSSDVSFVFRRDHTQRLNCFDTLKTYIVSQHWM